MSFPRSWVGAVLVLIYLVVAVYITQDEVRHSHGGWINLRGFGTTLITAPSQALLGPVLKVLGVPKVNYAHLRLSDYSQLVLHIVVSAAIVYFMGAGFHWIGRYALKRH